MGIEVIIHGFIECPFDFGRPDESTRIYKHNRKVIRSLPKLEGGYSCIDRSMFNVHPPKRIIPYYGTNLITFGGAYKNMYRFPSDWLCLFEQVLARICWHEASIFLQWGDLRCDWTAEDAYTCAFANPPRTPLRWSVRFAQLTKEDRTFSEAVDEIQSNLARDRPREGSE
jgi:hypothetical protein